MKLVNRLLIIAVIAFGTWFLVQHWDSVEAPIVEEGGEIVFEATEEEGELVFDVESDLSMEEQLEALREKAVQQTLLVPAETNMPQVQHVIQKETLSEKEIISSARSEVTVYLFDGGMDISNSIIPEGHVTFLVRNDGRVSHDFSIEGMEDFGRIVPGSSVSIEVDLLEGEYELFSPRDIDRSLDMRETLLVESTQ